LQLYEKKQRIGKSTYRHKEKKKETNECRKREQGGKGRKCKQKEEKTTEEKN